jgi:hypothetical protein
MSATKIPLLAALLLAIGVVLFTPSKSALAACGIGTSSCEGKSPVTEGCTSFGVLVQFATNSNNIREELWQDAGHCLATWTRIRTTNGAAYNYMYTGVWRVSDGAVYGGNPQFNVASVYSYMHADYVASYKGYGLYKITSSSNAQQIFTPPSR